MKTLKIHPDDNVLVALVDLPAGYEILSADNHLKLVAPCPAKHKILVQDLPAGSPVVMYGLVVGRTLKPLCRGEVIGTGNVGHDASPYRVREGCRVWQAPAVTRWRERTFMGYHRADGQAGTRNYWLVVPLVFCENRNVEYLRNAFLKQLGYARPDHYGDLVGRLIEAWRQQRLDHYTPELAEAPAPPARLFPNVDGVKFLRHDGGCGGTREDAENLCRLIAGYIKNPNVAGATVLSLGCQHAQIPLLQEALGEKSVGEEKTVLYFEQQQYASEPALLSAAIIATFRELVKANQTTRLPAPLSRLTVGLKCGGSDGFSGITANPAMGHLSDILVALGARTVLAEFPELCGVEQELIDRCARLESAEKFARLMTAYSRRAKAVGSGFDMNPSPGNIRDGLITDAMKSAGAARKGGTAPVAGVLDYAEYTDPGAQGLHLLCTPGNDVEATTGMAGSGATLIIFSTGLGTPTGNPVAPVVKTATNTILARRMPDIIDFDHGDIITCGTNIAASAEALLDHMIRVASGEVLTRAELLHQDDFIPWKRGVSL
jgi:altronate hydrolase